MRNAEREYSILDQRKYIQAFFSHVKRFGDHKIDANVPEIIRI